MNNLLIANYIKEYQRVNGNTPRLTYKGGWFTLDGYTKLRKKKLEAAMNVLKSRADYIIPSPLKFH